MRSATVDPRGPLSDANIMVLLMITKVSEHTNTHMHTYRNIYADAKLLLYGRFDRYYLSRLRGKKQNK